MWCDRGLPSPPWWKVLFGAGQPFMCRPANRGCLDALRGKFGLRPIDDAGWDAIAHDLIRKGVKVDA